MGTWEHRAVLEGNKDPPGRPSRLGPSCSPTFLFPSSLKSGPFCSVIKEFLSFQHSEMIFSAHRGGVRKRTGTKRNWTGERVENQPGKV